MHRATVRVFAFAILALLAAPVATHIVMHYLHDDPERRGDQYVAGAGSAPARTRIQVPAFVHAIPRPATWKVTATAERNVVLFGALRRDDVTGLQPLLSTYRI